jgi:hypothetical protein
MIFAQLILDDALGSAWFGSPWRQPLAVAITVGLWITVALTIVSGIKFFLRHHAVLVQGKT